MDPGTVRARILADPSSGGLADQAVNLNNFCAMPTPILICDDSSLARKQMARVLPDGWDVNISYAGNGLEALEGIRAGKGDVLFLDLNMPHMDGYEVLEAIREGDLPTLVIVVSGDIQPEAHHRVMKLGALDFIEKPVDKAKVEDILDRYGIFRKPVNQDKQVGGHDEENSITVSPETAFLECYQEVANVAMGRAADLLARLLDIFVVMPVPTVEVVRRDELLSRLKQSFDIQPVSVICQGFIGAGLAGESLLVFHDTRIEDIASLLRFQGEIDSDAESELLMDIACILIGAYLKGLAEQLDVSFSQGQPQVLGKNIIIGDFLRENSMNWNSILLTDMGCRIEGRQVHCNLMLLFTEDSINSLNNYTSFMMAD